MCKFHDPYDRGSCARAWPYQSYSEKNHILLYQYIVLNDDQGSVYQIWNFMTPWGRGSCVRAWPYQSYSEKNHILLYQYIAHWSLWFLLGYYYAAFPCHCWILFILWWSCWSKNMNPFEKFQCWVSDTQVTGKARGPLVYYRIDFKVIESEICSFFQY